MSELKNGTVYFANDDQPAQRFDRYTTVKVDASGVTLTHNSPSGGDVFMRHFYPACQVRVVEWRR